MVDGNTLMPSGAPQVYLETVQTTTVRQVMKEEDGTNSQPDYNEYLGAMNQSKKKNE